MGAGFVESLRHKKNLGPKDHKELVKSLSKLVSEADVVVAHNGDRFDLARLKARLAAHNIPPFIPDLRHTQSLPGDFSCSRPTVWTAFVGNSALGGSFTRAAMKPAFVACEGIRSSAARSKSFGVSHGSGNVEQFLVPDGESERVAVTDL
jgi:hypothetical protein